MAPIVVAIDPAATSGEDADETGIIVAGKNAQGHGYVLSDISGQIQLFARTAKLSLPPCRIVGRLRKSATAEASFCGRRKSPMSKTALYGFARR